MNGQQKEDQCIPSIALDQPTPLALTAVGKVETAIIFDESKMPQYLSKIVQKDTITFAHPGPEQDILFEPSYDHPATNESEDHGCSYCDPARIRSRRPRELQDPKVHGGLIASNQYLIRNGATRDEFAQKHGIFCFETAATGLRDVAQFLVIRGICDYADSHRSELWHAYAAAATAAYAKEVLCFIPTESKTPLATNLYAEAAPVLDVNLVHESAKEFFQSDQVNVKGINMFYMNQFTHRALMQTCLAHVERGYGNGANPQGEFDHDPFLYYASQYWPMHFNYAVHVIDARSEFARPFFAIDSLIRDEWWKVYWEQEKNGGNPPSFTLFHLAAYFGNVPCAKLLIGKHKHLISRKDNYGRTQLSWAVN